MLQTHVSDHTSAQRARSTSPEGKPRRKLLYKFIVKPHMQRRLVSPLQRPCAECPQPHEEQRAAQLSKSATGRRQTDATSKCITRRKRAEFSNASDPRAPSHVAHVTAEGVAGSPRQRRWTLRSPLAPFSSEAIYAKPPGLARRGQNRSSHQRRTAS
jgi:hypothetical protein